MNKERELEEDQDSGEDCRQHMKPGADDVRRKISSEQNSITYSFNTNINSIFYATFGLKV